MQLQVPKIYAHMTRLGIQSYEISQPWRTRAFLGLLPRPSTMVVWDSWFFEGRKIIYRVSIAILKLIKSKLLLTRSRDEFLETLTSATKSITAEPLLAKTFKVKLSRNNFQKLETRNTHLFLEFAPAPNMETYFRPKILEHSLIIDDHMFEVIWGWIPNRLRILDPLLLFRSSSHGFSLLNLLERCDEEHPLIMLFRSSSQVVGCFLTDSWKTNLRDSYFGNGEAFVFRLNQINEDESVCYNWNRSNSYFQVRTDRSFSVGSDSYDFAHSLIVRCALCAARCVQ
jgi:hypothetical protein